MKVYELREISWEEYLSIKLNAKVPTGKFIDTSIQNLGWDFPNNVHRQFLIDATNSEFEAKLGL